MLFPQIITIFLCTFLPPSGIKSYYTVAKYFLRLLFEIFLTENTVYTKIMKYLHSTGLSSQDYIVLQKLFQKGISDYK